MLTHGAGAKLRLATERDLLDAGAAEETVVVEGDTFALSSKRGKRRMSYEDAYVAAPGLDGDPTQGIFSVFDGHGEGRLPHLHRSTYTTRCSRLSETHAQVFLKMKTKRQSMW